MFLHVCVSSVQVCGLLDAKRKHYVIVCILSRNFFDDTHCTSCLNEIVAEDYQNLVFIVLDSACDTYSAGVPVPAATRASINAGHCVSWPQDVPVEGDANFKWSHPEVSYFLRSLHSVIQRKYRKHLQPQGHDPTANCSGD